MYDEGEGHVATCHRGAVEDEYTSSEQHYKLQNFTNSGGHVYYQFTQVFPAV
jgi:hypothetical protein